MSITLTAYPAPPDWTAYPQGADLSGGGEAPTYEVSFAGTIPLQTLTANVQTERPVFEASFAATIPLQTLSASISYADPVDPGTDDRAIDFAATVPLQTLSAGLSVEVPVYEVSFAATIPMQVSGLVAPAPLQLLEFEVRIARRIELTARI